MYVHVHGNYLHSLGFGTFVLCCFLFKRIKMGECVCDKCVYERERSSRMCARRMLVNQERIQREGPAILTFASIIQHMVIR